VTIVTFWMLKKQWTVALVMLLLFGMVVPLAAAATPKSSCPSAGKTVFVIFVGSSPQTAAVGSTVVTTVNVCYESNGVGESPTVSPQTMSFRWASAAGEKIVENAPVAPGGGPAGTYMNTQAIGDDFPTGKVTISVVACSCSDGQGNSGPPMDVNSDTTSHTTDDSTIEIGATTQQPATQDMLVAYSVPVVIAIVVILAVLLLILRRRKKKT
jgi:hypothetical protein